MNTQKSLKVNKRVSLFDLGQFGAGISIKDGSFLGASFNLKEAQSAYNWLGDWIDVQKCKAREIEENFHVV